jgi:hypothetical protein
MDRLSWAVPRLPNALDFHDLQERDHHKECLSLLSEQGSVIKVIIAAIPGSTIYDSMFHPDFELHYPNTENRRPHIRFSPMTGLASSRPPMREFISPTTTVPAKSPAVAQAKATKTGAAQFLTGRPERSYGSSKGCTAIVDGLTQHPKAAQEAGERRQQ